MSKIEVDAIDKQSGSTLTLGGSGTAVTLGTGATQSGFGRTGTVDWQTGSIKTGDFTGANGEGYFINTTAGAITMTLPTATAGDIISIQDYNNTFDDNNFIIQAGSGIKINGGTAAGKLILSTEGQGLTLVFVDSTVGWRSIESTTFSTESVLPTYIAATGGTVTTSGSFKIHTFTGPGTFCVSAVGNASGSDKVDYLVIAGGASGGNGSSAGGYGAGGGGAGGYRESSGSSAGCYTRSPLGACVSALPVTATGYPVTVGAGGSIKGSDNDEGNPGSNSVFAGTTTITSAGGGAGGGTYQGPQKNGSNGGSGGGGGSGASEPPTTPANGGSGNTPPVSPPQGNAGGNGSPPSGEPGAGGGGATAAGQNAPTNGSGQGGAGGTSSINATPTARAGGGGGGGLGRAGAAGGSGGGGAGGPTCSSNGIAGTTNTGGGGGGASGGTGRRGGAGGSGVVIIRYKFQD